MEDTYVENSVRTRLILAGINEIRDHGIKDFSLRRAALSAEVSCAAPYRHFKNKEEFISEIVKYIAAKWNLLCKEIYRVYENNTRQLLIELAVAELRFWVANPNFRSVLVLLDAKLVSESFEHLLFEVLDKYCKQTGQQDIIRLKIYFVRAIIYGTLTLIEDGEEAPDFYIAAFREKLEKEFE